MYAYYDEYYTNTDGVSIATRNLVDVVSFLLTSMI